MLSTWHRHALIMGCAAFAIFLSDIKHASTCGTWNWGQSYPSKTSKDHAPEKGEWSCMHDRRKRSCDLEWLHQRESLFQAAFLPVPPSVRFHPAAQFPVGKCARSQLIPVPPFAPLWSTVQLFRDSIALHTTRCTFPARSVDHRRRKLDLRRIPPLIVRYRCGLWRRASQSPRQRDRCNAKGVAAAEENPMGRHSEGIREPWWWYLRMVEGN